MRSDFAAIVLLALVVIAAVITVRILLCGDRDRATFVRILDEHAPLIEKDKHRVILLYPASVFREIIVGTNLPKRRILPIPDRFVPIDYRTLASFGTIWLLTPTGKSPRPFVNSLFTLEKVATTFRFTLYRLTLPSHLSFTAAAGGGGGNPGSILCQGQTSPEFSFFVGPTEEIVALRLICRNRDGNEKEQKTFGDPRRGTITLVACPDGATPTGMTLYTDTLVRGIMFHCSSDEITPIGRTNLSSTRLTCPTGSTIRGLFGSSGARIDSLGLVCGH